MKLGHKATHVVAAELKTGLLALRPDGARGVPPVLDPASDGGPLTVAYLDEVIAGQPSGHLAGADLPMAGDLAAFVHTGGTTGARRSPRTPTPTSWPARGGSPSAAAWHPGRRCWAGCHCSTSTP